MSPRQLFETASLTEGYRRGRCEDCVNIVVDGERVIIAVADGAGGIGDGLEAATMVIERVKSFATKTHSTDSWCNYLKEIDLQIGAGESTGVVVDLSADGIRGCSVGDSQAWIIKNGQLENLTRQQQRKPLLGSGKANPVGFLHGPLNGLLIVATDGFCNYVKRPALFNATKTTGLNAMPKRFIDLVRLPSGELWDDVGIVVCQRKKQPSRYSGRIELAFENF